MQKSSNKLRKNLKRGNRGITLIALVVTIIVLLILAGISIQMLTGNSGILTQTQNAKDSTRGGDVQEQVNLAVSENAIAEYTSGTKKTRDGVISELYRDKKLTENEYNKLMGLEGEEQVNVLTIGNITIDFSALGSISNANTLVAMYEQAEADNCTNQDGTCTNENHLHIGDYVNYTNPTSGTYTVPANQLGVDYAQRYDVALNQLNWRVMGKDSSTGGIKIMASQPMRKSNDGGTALNSDPYLYMYGAKSYTNSLAELENICKMYTTSYGKARSITQDDVDALTGVTTTALKQQYNIDAYHGNKNLGESYSYDNQYTPESWLNDKTTTTVSGTVTGYYYSVNSGYESDAPYVTMSNNRAYNMLFNNTEVGSGRYYWLASLGVYVYSSFAGFGPGILISVSGIAATGTYVMFDSRGYEYEYFAAVCPVVSLKSDVTKDDVSKAGDKTETNWNYGGGSGRPN